MLQLAETGMFCGQLFDLSERLLPSQQGLFSMDLGT
jgi:hypothetical protein